MATKSAVCIIYKSPDGENNWTPVKPEDVPGWIKEPDVMARLVKGEMARNDRSALLVPEDARPWYRAHVVTPATEVDRIMAAEVKRKRKNAKRISTVH